VLRPLAGRPAARREKGHPAIPTSTYSDPVIAITAGEPAGIGPDLCVALARERVAAQIVIVADRRLLIERAQTVGIALKCEDFVPGAGAPAADNCLRVAHLPLGAAVTPGKLDPANSAYVLRTLEAAVDGCRSGIFDALTTAPVHKGVINDAGFPFTGHTEFLAARLAVDHVVMMLVGGGMRVALATTHLPLHAVPSHITRESLEQTLRVLHRDLVSRFGLSRPRIAVAGLNPHAGEAGYLGSEEIVVIAPVLEALRAQGLDLTGPLPADMLFHPRQLTNFDCVLAMYHDQGLPVLKHASFGSGVNVTLGLPIIRTSVDHGTALDLAGTGKAEVGSLVEAIDVAAKLVMRSRRAAP
jgi:4-hydroxythreonine-4-phosphate dehydrogenase